MRFIYIYTYVCAYVCACQHNSTHTHMYICIHIYMCALAFSNEYIYIYVSYIHAKKITVMPIPSHVKWTCMCASKFEWRDVHVSSTACTSSSNCDVVLLLEYPVAMLNMTVCPAVTICRISSCSAFSHVFPQCGAP